MPKNLLQLNGLPLGPIQIKMLPFEFVTAAHKLEILHQPTESPDLISWAATNDGPTGAKMRVLIENHSSGEIRDAGEHTVEPRHLYESIIAVSEGGHLYSLRLLAETEFIVPTATFHVHRGQQDQQRLQYRPGDFAVFRREGTGIAAPRRRLW